MARSTDLHHLFVSAVNGVVLGLVLIQAPCLSLRPHGCGSAGGCPARSTIRGLWWHMQLLRDQQQITTAMVSDHLQPWTRAQGHASHMSGR